MASMTTEPGVAGPAGRPAAPSPPDERDEAFWRDYLTRGDSLERRMRLVFNRLPHDPRCKLCAAPFAGVAAPLMRAMGRRRSDQNPQMCTSCFRFVATHHGGAEIECTMLFADIRGSTTLAESMSSLAFRDLLDRFYTVASTTVFDHQGVVDKFVGDELVAMFFPLMSGDDHARLAVAAARRLLEATGHGSPGGPWVPVGAGVHTAVTWFGAVGQGQRTELTVVGDPVNTTARLASSAAAGEILVTTDAAAAAGLDPSLERRQLALKGKQSATEVVAIHIGP
jgi:adenylate cyclase